MACFQPCGTLSLVMTLVIQARASFRPLDYNDGNNERVWKEPGKSNKLSLPLPQWGSLTWGGAYAFLSASYLSKLRTQIRQPMQHSEPRPIGASNTSFPPLDWPSGTGNHFKGNRSIGSVTNHALAVGGRHTGRRVTMQPALLRWLADTALQPNPAWHWCATDGTLGWSLTPSVASEKWWAGHWAISTDQIILQWRFHRIIHRTHWCDVDREWQRHCFRVAGRGIWHLGTADRHPLELALMVISLTMPRLLQLQRGLGRELTALRPWAPSPRALGRAQRLQTPTFPAQSTLEWENNIILPCWHIGTSQTITNGDTLTIAAGTGVTTTAGEPLTPSLWHCHQQRWHRLRLLIRPCRIWVT